jgi:hypothetical protein
MKTSLPLRSALCALLLLACALPAALAAPFTAVAKEVEGSAEYTLPGDGVFHALTVGTELPSGSRVRTKADGLVYILTLPGAAIRVGGNSDMTLSEVVADASAGTQDKAKAIISLQSGTVHALIKKEMSKEVDLRIRTPQGVAAARGTFFGVHVDKGNSYVAVREGKVKVQSKGKGI